MDSTSFWLMVTALTLIVDVLIKIYYGGSIVAVSQEVAAFISDVNVATNKIAQRIQDLINKPTVALSAEDKAALAGVVTDLNALGADPNNPLPPTS
jgi:hypothetical protein